MSRESSQLSIGREKAIAMHNSGWWKGQTAREIVGYPDFDFMADGDAVEISPSEAARQLGWEVQP